MMEKVEEKRVNVIRRDDVRVLKGNMKYEEGKRD